MNFDLAPRQQQWRGRAGELGRRVTAGSTPQEIVRGAAAEGLLDVEDDLLAVVVALDALAAESASPAMLLALHYVCVLSMPADASLVAGARVGALTLAADEMPVEGDGRLNGRASWVAPLTGGGVALVGARHGTELVACALELESPGISVEPVPLAGLPGLVMGHLVLTDAPCTVVGPTPPVMTRARLCTAAVGLGVARRAVREALGSARGTSRGAGGEQTAQGLIADAATDLDAAMLLTWSAAVEAPSLGRASMAKLAATFAGQRAVERAAQVIGAESFREGHIIERLARDVRALELLAGRTEALREAVALECL